MVVKMAPCVQTESRPWEPNVQLIENRPHLHCKGICFSTVQFRYTSTVRAAHDGWLDAADERALQSPKTCCSPRFLKRPDWAPLVRGQ